MVCEQINLYPSSGRDYRVRRHIKKQVTHHRRHQPIDIEGDERGGKGEAYNRHTHGWMY